MTHFFKTKLCGVIVLLLLTHSFLCAQDVNDPAAELASFQIAEGFAVNLFASENNGVVKPIQMRFDARGRLWVIGTSAYPQIEPGQIPSDKVLIVEDTDKDGRCDKTTVFADDLMIPTGIELGNGGVYIGHGTELLFLEDTNGDDKADKRRVVLRGFGTGDSHQNINSFTWGPGGELWMCQGLHAHSNVETLWGIVRLNQAGIFRFRPRRGQLEGFYGSQNEPQNPWGFVFTDWGEPIVLAGNNSSPIYPVPGLVSNHRDLPPTLIWKEGHGRKVSGGEIVGTSHFPDDWQGLLIKGGYLNNAVWALKIQDDGAGFVLENVAPLIKSTHASFRPVDVKFGPEGALYVADWYNPIIGHYQTSFRHPDRDKKHGRIWRVTAKDRALTSVPQLINAGVHDLLGHLKSPDRWTRHFAKRVLADKSTSQVIGALNKWTKDENLSEHTLKEALGVYQSHEVIAPDLLEHLSRAKDPGARAYAANVVGLWADQLNAPLRLLRALVADENPRVRLQAIVACTYVKQAEAMETVAVASDFPSDKFLEYGLKQAVFALKPYWLASFKAGKLNFENKPSRLKFLIQADGTTDTLQAIRDIVKKPELDAGTKETFLRTLIDIGDATDVAAVLRLEDPSLLLRLMPVLCSTARVRDLRPPGDVAPLVTPLVNASHIEIQAEALKLAAVWKAKSFRPKIEEIALNGSGNLILRRGAIEALAKFADEASKNTLVQLSADSTPLIQSAAIAALTSIDVSGVAQFVPTCLARLTDESSVKEMFSAFLQRKGGADALAQTLATNPPPKHAAQVGLNLMSAAGRYHPGLNAVLAAAAGLNSHSQQMTSTEITAFVDEVRRYGDTKCGLEIFRRPELGCLACHSVQGEGGNLGPDLSSLGTAQPTDFIIGAILEPQKEIKEGFMSISVTTTDGEEYQGYFLRETSEELVLRDVLQKKEVRLARSAIKNKKQNGSVMPAGLADTLTRNEFRDLVRFLSELGKAK